VIKKDVAFISVIEFRKSNAGLGPWEPVTPHETKITDDQHHELFCRVQWN